MNLLDNLDVEHDKESCMSCGILLSLGITTLGCIECEAYRDNEIIEPDSDPEDLEVEELEF